MTAVNECTRIKCDNNHSCGCSLENVRIDETGCREFIDTKSESESKVYKAEGVKGNPQIQVPQTTEKDMI